MKKNKIIKLVHDKYENELGIYYMMLKRTKLRKILQKY